MQNSTLLPFLEDLRINNSLEWMHANEDRKIEATAEFTELVQDLIALLAETEPELARLDAKSLMFRLNRDTRFSKDKAPYNPVFRAHISSAGKQSIPVGYFLSITPGGSFAGGGLYAPNFSDAVKRMRAYITDHGTELDAIMNTPAFKDTFEFTGLPLKNVPKEYDRDHPQAEYIKCRCWSIESKLPNELVNDPAARKTALLETFALMRDFNQYCNRALEGFEMPRRGK